MTLEQLQEIKADLEQIRNFAWQGRVPSSHRPAKAAKHSDLFRFIHERAGKAIGELDKAFPAVQQGVLVKNRPDPDNVFVKGRRAFEDAIEAHPFVPGGSGLPVKCVTCGQGFSAPQHQHKEIK